MIIDGHGLVGKSKSIHNIIIINHLRDQDLSQT